MLKIINIKRNCIVFVAKLRRSINGKDKVKLPKKLTESEKMVITIFLETLRDPSSMLFYNITNGECSIENKKSKVYLFLETCNLKVVNSVYGYDINISLKVENYLSSKFIFEATRRRNKFKQSILDGVEHSLQKTLDSIIKKPV